MTPALERYQVGNLHSDVSGSAACRQEFGADRSER